MAKTPANEAENSRSIELAENPEKRRKSDENRRRVEEKLERIGTADFPAKQQEERSTKRRSTKTK